MMTFLKKGLTLLALAVCSTASGQVVISAGTASACGGVLYDTAVRRAGYSRMKTFVDVVPK